MKRLLGWIQRRRDRSGWGVYVYDEDHTLVAVAPQHDAVGHDLYDEDCVCGPRWSLIREATDERPDGWMLTHEALDGRP